MSFDTFNMSFRTDGDIMGMLLQSQSFSGVFLYFMSCIQCKCRCAIGKEGSQLPNPEETLSEGCFFFFRQIAVPLTPAKVNTIIYVFTNEIDIEVTRRKVSASSISLYNVLSYDQ